MAKQSRAERAYRLLLRLLPQEFRGDFGDEMEEMFRQQRRDAARAGGRVATARLWLETVGGLLAVAPREHLDALTQDVRFAMRSLRRAPGLWAAITVTLALAIGANTAVFSAVNAVLLRAPSFPGADRLVVVWARQPAAKFPQLPLSYPNYSDLRQRARSFEDVAAWAATPERRLAATGTGEAEEIQYAAATANLFAVLGVRPLAGRLFVPAEDEGGAPRTAVITYALWQRRFGGARDVIGQSLRLDGVPYAIIGVLPSGFDFVTFPRPPDVWLPLNADPLIGDGARSLRYARGASFLGVIGRLKAGVSHAAAAADLSGVARSLALDYPAFNRQRTLHAVGLQEQVAGAVRPALLVLMGAVGLLLAVACANVANLLLAHAATREGELLLRASLGAARGRLVRQLLTEGIVTSLGGGVLGVIVAAGAVRLPVFASLVDRAFFTPYGIAQRDLVDGRVLAFTAAVTLVTAISFSVLPALRLSRPFGATTAIVPGRTTRRASRLSRALVVIEVALSLALLVGSGLLVRSFVRLQNVDLGFSPDHVVAARLNLARSRYARPELITAFFDELLAKANALPGVSAAAIVEHLPLTGPGLTTTIRIEGQPVPDDLTRFPVAQFGAVGGDYGRALGIRLVAGRAFRDADDGPAGQRVTIVNEAFARSHWPGGSAIGKRLAISNEALRFDRDGPPRLDFDSAWRTVVGVVANTRQDGAASQPRPEVYAPYRQRAEARMTLVIRSADAGVVPSAQALRSLVAGIDPAQPVSDVLDMSALVSASLRQPRFRTVLLGLFSLVALALAATGIFGLVSYSAARRVHEMGIRVALGARPAQLVRLVVWQGLQLVLAGVACGLALSAVLAHALSGLVFDLAPTDPPTYVLQTMVLLVVALVAAWLPARRATSGDPLRALRKE